MDNLRRVIESLGANGIAIGAVAVAIAFLGAVVTVAFPPLMRIAKRYVRERRSQRRQARLGAAQPFVESPPRMRERAPGEPNVSFAPHSRPTPREPLERRTRTLRLAIRTELHAERRKSFWPNLWLNLGTNFLTNLVFFILGVVVTVFITQPH